MPTDYLTVAETMEILRCSENTLRRWINSGELPSLKLGPKMIRIPRAGLTGFVESRSVTVVGAAR